MSVHSTGVLNFTKSCLIRRMEALCLRASLTKKVQLKSWYSQRPSASISNI